MFILDTNALDTTIGVKLLQLQEREEKVISYGSFTLNPAQRNYCTTRKELLAVVRFSREFHHYLLGRQFLVHTDHSSLTWLMHFHHPEGMLAQWLEELSQYDMVIQHCKKHGNADGLSQIPEKEDFCNCYEAGISLSSLPCGGYAFCTKVHHQWAQFEDGVDDVIPLSICSASLTDDLSTKEILSAESPSCDESDTNWLPQYSTDQLQKAQLKDPNLSKLVHWLEADEECLINDLYLCSPAVKKFWLNWSQLKM